MQQNIFCPNCGTKHTLSSNFCTSCGNSLKSVSTIKPTQKSNIITIENDEDENNSNISIPNISKLDVEIEIPQKKETVKDLAFSEKLGPLRVIPKKVNNKKLIEEFQKEAGKGGSKESISID